MTEQNQKITKEKIAELRSIMAEGSTLITEVENEILIRVAKHYLPALLDRVEAQQAALESIRDWYNDQEGDAPVDAGGNENISYPACNNCGATCEKWNTRHDIYAAAIAERDALKELQSKVLRVASDCMDARKGQIISVESAWEAITDTLDCYSQINKENAELKALCEQLAGALEDFNILYDQMRASLCIRGAAWHTIGADRQNMSIAQIGAKKALTAYEKYKEKS